MTKNRAIVWNSNLAYAIGLFVADGSLSKDGRHLEFTSKDLEQVENFAKCLELNHLIRKKSRETGGEKNYFHIQFGDIKFYRFLVNIGIENGKSLTIKKVDLPKGYFSDFLRGYFDGDGSIGSSNHPESNKLQIRIRFTSGSYKFLQWLMKQVKLMVDVEGGYITAATRCWQLNYGKRDSLQLINYMYYSNKVVCLGRKLNKVKGFFNLHLTNNSVKSQEW